MRLKSVGVLQIIIVLAVSFSLITGCGKKDSGKEGGQQTQSTSSKPSSSDLINLADIDQDIISSFKTIKNLIYPNGKIASQEKTIMDAQYAYLPDVPACKEATIIIQSQKSVNDIYDFYKKVLPENLFKISKQDDTVLTASCSYVDQKAGFMSTPLEIQVRISQPYRNFQENILTSQLDVIKAQIAQYEKILEVQKVRKNQDNDSKNNEVLNNAIDHCQKQITRLKVQSDVLINKSTMVELRLAYTSLAVNLKKKIQDEKGNDSDNEAVSNNVSEKDNEKDNSPVNNVIQNVIEKDNTAQADNDSITPVVNKVIEKDNIGEKNNN